MFERKHRQIRHIVAAVVLTAGASIGHALAQQASPAPEQLIEQAASLLDQGKFVHARALLIEASNEPAELTDAQRSRVFGLLKTAKLRLDRADPLDVSLQRADLALAQGDLRLAQRHAQAVADATSAGPERIAQAQRQLQSIADRQAELAPMIPQVIDRAIGDFFNGRYTEAKAGFEAVLRSGIDLTPEQQVLVGRYQSKLIEVEHERGVLFDAGPAMAGVFQPGLVKRHDDPPAEPNDLPTGVEEVPAGDVPIVVDEPVEEVPAAEETPGLEYIQPPAEPVQPSEDDIIRQARVWQAQSLLSEADLAYQESKFNEAATKYNEVTTTYRDFLSIEQIQHAEARLAETRLRLRERSGVEGLDDVVNLNVLAKQETLATFNAEIDQANRSLASGDTRRARELAAKAKVTLTGRRNLFPPSEFEELIGRVSQLQDQIEKTAESLRRTEAEQLEKNLAERAAQAALSRTRERERKITEHIARIRALQLEMKYGEALEVVDQILFLDPTNQSALLLKEIIQDLQIYTSYNALQRRKQSAYVSQTIENEEAFVPPSRLITYPADWPKISYLRGQPFDMADSAENRRTLAELKNRRLPVNFNDNSLAEVTDFLATITQLDFDVDWATLDELGISPDSTVSLKLSNAPIETILNRVVEKVSPDDLSRAGWAVENGIVVIASDEALRKNTILRIYDVRDLLIEVPDYEDAPEIDLQQAIQSGRGGGGAQSPFRNTNQQQDVDRKPLDERIDDLLALVMDNVDPDGWRENGGDTGFAQQFNGQLIITNTAKNHRAIGNLLSKLREVKAIQINVETRFLLVNQDFFEQIGFDLDVYFNANNNQVRFAQGNDPTIQASDFFDFTAGGIKRDVTGAQFGQDTDGDGIGDTALTQGVINPRSTSVLGAPQNSLGLASALMPAEGIAASVLSGAPAMGLAGQFLDDIQVDFLVRATQADRRSIQLTAPRLTVTNGQISHIYVVTQRAYVSDLQPVTSDSAVGFDPTVDVVAEGFVMLIEPVASADRRYVTLNVDAGIARIDGFATEAVTAVAGGRLVNSADTASFIQLPTVTVTRVRTTATIPDQGTMLLGGQRLVTEFEVETGVPVLSKIPVINRFFSNRIESKDEQTLLILVKPTLLIQNEAEDEQFPGLRGQIGSGIGG
jgi:type II secretory pathway component GspD/PulD (secretin)